ncbi:Maf family protein [Propionicicella superfundia]|uniref:Maf family protein n=1 Tax=Propionicicella superfundia TaxID=348582 RepID=UPI00041195A2|nr:Maf family protein [Propionicicella superfundia]
MSRPRFVLASKSPARLATLRAAGLDPEVIVSGVDEGGIDAATPPELVATLARLKADAVAARIADEERTVVLGCDSVLEFNGAVHGKPGTAQAATERWQQLRGGTGVLHTGHHVVVLAGENRWDATRVASTVVRFADPTDEEIAAYVATGEPQGVAGAFTIDGYGGAYITALEGDPHNVVGVSLPLVRMMLADLGVKWHTLWRVRGAST